MRTKKVLDSLHFWVGEQSGEIYVGVRNKHGGVGERVVVTEKVVSVVHQYERGFKDSEATATAQ